MQLGLYYLDVTGPGVVTFTPSNPEYKGVLTNDYNLAEGQASQDLALEAARQFAADILQAFGVHVDVSTDPADYPPSQPEPVDAILHLYLDRAGPYAGPAQRVIARWAAYNHVQLASEREGWTQEGVAGLLATPRCQAVVAALTTFGWGLAAATLQAATTEDHPLATPDVVEAYLAAMGAEGYLP